MAACRPGPGAAPARSACRLEPDGDPPSGQRGPNKLLSPLVVETISGAGAAALTLNGCEPLVSARGPALIWFAARLATARDPLLRRRNEHGSKRRTRGRSEVALVVRNVSISFGGVLAVDAMDLDVAAVDHRWGRSSSLRRARRREHRPYRARLDRTSRHVTAGDELLPRPAGSRSNAASWLRGPATALICSSLGAARSSDPPGSEMRVQGGEAQPALLAGL